MDAEVEDDDLDLSTANTYRPSTMGISFLAELHDNAVLHVAFTGGRYRRKDNYCCWPATRVVDTELVTSLRNFHERQHANGHTLEGGGAANVEHENTDNLDLRVEVFARPFDNCSLITACIVNRTQFVGAS